MDARLPQDEIPFIPAKVDIADVIHTGGRLIAQEDVASVKAAIKHLKQNSDGRFSKKELQTKYSIIKIDNQFYAIYKGVKHNKHLGKGAFGTVKLVQNIDDGSWAVIKTIVRTDGKSKPSSISREISQLKQINQFIGDVDTRFSKSKKGEQDTILMKLAHGVPVDVFIHDKQRNMSPVKWLDFALAITRAVSALHGQGILHRDIKPENMLFHPATGVVTIIDFGLGQPIDQDTPDYEGRRGVGSPKYMAPEIRKPDKDDTKKILPHRAKSTASYQQLDSVSYNETTEIYALGMTLIELFGFKKKDNHVDFDFDTLKRISNPQHREKIRTLLTNMISPDHKLRPTMDQVLDTLTTLRESEIDLLSKVNILSCINVNDYIHASVFQRGETLKAARAADEVMLCCSPTAESQMECMRLKHELEGLGICVLSDAVLLQNNDKDSISQTLKQRIKKLSADQDVIYRAHYVSPLVFQEGQSYTHTKLRNLDHVVITDEHKKIAAARIGKQLARMKQKNPQDINLQYYSHFLYELEQGNIKTYDQLFSALHQLENELSSKLANTFGFLSKAAQKVQKTTRIIDEDARGVRKPPGNKTL